MVHIPVDIKKHLIKRAADYAEEQFSTREIFPCGECSDFECCFQYDQTARILSFWFNIHYEGRDHTSVVYQVV